MNAPADKSSQTNTSADPSAPQAWGWNRRQRIGLGTLLSLLLIVLLIQYFRRPATTSVDPATDTQPLLPQYLDPNTSSAAQLARVPHLGDTLAARIVAYREARKPTTTDGIVFRQPADLANVPGIGPKLSQQFAPYFKFPPPETQPN